MVSWPLQALRQDGMISRTTSRVQIVPLLPTIPKSARSRTIFSCLFNGCLVWPTRRENVLCVRLHVDGLLTLPGRWDGYKQGLSLPLRGRSELQGLGATGVGRGGCCLSPAFPIMIPSSGSCFIIICHAKSFFFFLAVYSGLILEICFHLPTLTPGAACKLPRAKNQWWQQWVGSGPSLTWSSEQPQPCLLSQGWPWAKMGSWDVFLWWPWSFYSEPSLPVLCFLLYQNLLPRPHPLSMGDGVGRWRKISECLHICQALG